MPQAVAAVVTAAAAALGFSATVTSILVTVAQIAVTQVVTAGLKSLFTPKSRSTAQEGQNVPRASEGHITVRQPTPVRVSGYGRARLAGAYMLYYRRDGVSYDVLALHAGQVSGYEQFYLNDDAVTLNAGDNGNPQELPDGRYGENRIQIYNRSGAANEVAFSQIVDAIPDIWTADHRGDGIASLAMICDQGDQENFSKIYPNGLPSLSVVARLQSIHDPRSNASGWSQNPILCLLHYLTNTENGMGFEYARRFAPAIETWKKAANVCDEGVALKDGGWAPRYRCGGFYTHDTEPADVVAQLLLTCDGWMAARGDGAMVVYAGQFYEPTVTITADHILEFSIQRFVADEEAINALTVNYTSPAHNFNDVDAEVWIDGDDQAARGGKERAQSLQATWVQDFPQARRLAKREVIKANSGARGVIRTTLYGLAALGERYIRIQNPTLTSLSNITAEVTNLEMDLSNLSVIITWVWITDTIDLWNPQIEEGTPPPVAED